jgi:hypothetical protein
MCSKCGALTNITYARVSSSRRIRSASCVEAACLEYRLRRFEEDDDDDDDEDSRAVVSLGSTATSARQHAMEREVMVESFMVVVVGCCCFEFAMGLNDEFSLGQEIMSQLLESEREGTVYERDRWISNRCTSTCCSGHVSDT